MTGETYPSTPYLRRLTAENGWHGQLIRDRAQPMSVGEFVHRTLRQVAHAITGNLRRPLLAGCART